MIGHSRTRVLLAVIAGHRSVRSIAAAVGIYFTTAHQHLTALRRDGLVDWVDGRASTIHALVRPIDTSGRAS